jgi:hypothetical protein
VRNLIIVALCILVCASLAMAQTYVGGATGITGVDKLGAHQNGGRGCVGCHAPHSGARGNGGNAATGGGPVTDPNTGNFALWGQDLGPLYNKTLNFGDSGNFAITLPADSISNESLTTGVMMCLSCHDGNFAKGAMMTNRSWEKDMGLLPAGYGPNPIPTLLGADSGTANGNYENDHPIGPLANLGALNLTSRLVMSTCGTAPNTVNCLQVNETNTAYAAFRDHYGTFNVTYTRTNPLVLPTANVADAYVVCTTCHTPHTMYTYSITQPAAPAAPLAYTKAPSGTYPSYFFVWAPYNPGATPASNQASSATQFCRQCHFTGAGGANEGSGIMGITTKW